MAHTGAVRQRARALFLARAGSLADIARRCRVGEGSVKRWSAAEGWAALRDQNDELEKRSRELALEITASATKSGDPQAVFAATHAAHLAGVGERPGAPPAAAVVARALIAALAEDAELGPILRRRRDLVGLVAEKAEELDALT